MPPRNLISGPANGHRNVGSKAVGQRSQNDLLEQIGPAVCKEDDAMANGRISDCFRHLPLAPPDKFSIGDGGGRRRLCPSLGPWPVLARSPGSVTAI